VSLLASRVFDCFFIALLLVVQDPRLIGCAALAFAFCCKLLLAELHLYTVIDDTTPARRIEGGHHGSVL
jgi:hypothetical protein